MYDDITNFVKSNSRLDLKNDYVFKKIFSKPENSNELKELLEAILEIKIDKIEVKNPELPKSYKDEKLGILDILAYVNDNTIIDVEMQVGNVNTIVNRDIRYSSKIISDQLKVGDKYQFLKKFVSINFLGDNLLRRNTYHSIVHLKFEDIDPDKYVDMGYKQEQQILTDKIEAHYIELSKFIKKNPGFSKKLEQWLWLIVGEEDKVKMISEENKTIEKIVDDLDEMSADENERLEAYSRELAIWDYNVSIAESKEEGIALGKKDVEKKTKEIAKKMKEKGLDIETIVEITGLSKEEIKSL